MSSNISSLELKRFRSYREAAFEFEPGVNIIVGPNASGKTNLLEAIHLTLRGKSFRTKDPSLVAFGADWSRIDIHKKNERRTVKLLQQNDARVKKEFEINDRKFMRLSLQRTVPAVLFEPNHLLLISRSPEARRDYLDELNEQMVPGYSRVRREYKRTLAQRNALLKRGYQAESQLFAWNIRLCETGAVLAARRAELAGKINGRINDLYSTLAGSDSKKLAIKYVSSVDMTNYSSKLLKRLEERTAIDIERGFTTVGPHREDILIKFDGRPAVEVASRGETRTLMLALKIIELEFIENSRGQQPVLLLDDVFSELDGRRRKALTESLKDYQTFITTTDADVVLHHFTEKCNVIALS